MSKARLKVIRETTDGFRIAEEDLRLRGEGDVLGVRQSGLPGYRIARSEVHGQLITQARDEALRIMKDNPKLRGERGEALRCLLYLFERDEAIPLIGAVTQDHFHLRRLGCNGRRPVGDPRRVRHARKRRDLLLRVGARLHHAAGHDQRRGVLGAHVDFDDLALRHVEEEAGGRVRRARQEHRDVVLLPRQAAAMSALGGCEISTIDHMPGEGNSTRPTRRKLEP